MIGRRLLISLLALSALAPASIGSSNATLRGRLLPDLPQHLESANRDLEKGLVQDAIAHLDLVLMDRPVRYRFDFHNLSEERQAECAAAFRDATAMWQRALGKEVEFKEVGAGEPAELNVTFQSDVKQSGNEVAGFVTWRRKVEGNPPQMSLNAEVKVRTQQPTGEPMLLEHMRHTCAHELGHVLGLDDSPYFGDIMGPLDLKHPVIDFEASELENLKAVRAEALQVRQQALAKSN